VVVLLHAGVPIQASAGEPVQPPVAVLAQVPAKTYYVGQAIELRIGADAADERPEVVPPQIPNTDVALIGTDLSPVAATGIGNRTSERNLFVTRFRLIAHRAGPLAIPPVRVRLGSRWGSSRPLTIQVHNTPLEGRPPEFLGGVGAFAVDAEATPSTVRLGQEFTYTVVVTGPAARGMTSKPGLGRFAQVPLGLQVESLPAVAVGSPPSRRFPYKIRPTRPGAASLPPVAVAAFDPLTERYLTRVTSSVAIQVVDVPKLDPATVDYRLPPARGNRFWPGPVGVRLGTRVGLAGFALVLAVLLTRAALRRWRVDPGWWLVRRARRIAPGQDPAQTAREIADTLTAYLERATGRPRGALTPEEARTAIAEASGDAGLGIQAASLIAECDRASYACADRELPHTDLVTEARRLFEAIGRKRRTCRVGNAHPTRPITPGRRWSRRQQPRAPSPCYRADGTFYHLETSGAPARIPRPCGWESGG
jgi:hypothetical protein